MIKKIIKKIIGNCVWRLKLIFDIYHIEQLKNSFIGDKAVIHASARINNFSRDKNKINIGENTVIDGELLIFNYGGEIIIGDNCYIGEGSRIWSGESIRIGNYVLISHNVNIVDTNSHETNHIERGDGYVKLLKKGHSKDKGNINTASVIIEDYAWINFNSVILKGVKIGRGSIIAAGSVVTKDVSPFTMVAGNPAVVIKHLNETDAK
ncbi:MAG: hypothetical protein A2X02_05105 [Bacteroidetes bacterium GWF2_29_10]|nr:MAG: hypothetical protein A2X02_05105 [Bacteroidetes bacterium GWF2_29_10]